MEGKDDEGDEKSLDEEEGEEEEEENENEPEYREPVLDGRNVRCFVAAALFSPFGELFSSLTLSLALLFFFVDYVSNQNSERVFGLFYLHGLLQRRPHNQRVLAHVYEILSAIFFFFLFPARFFFPFFFWFLFFLLFLFVLSPETAIFSLQELHLQAFLVQERVSTMQQRPWCESMGQIQVDSFEFPFVFVFVFLSFLSDLFFFCLVQIRPTIAVIGGQTVS
jgi:hypothetical protein